MSEKDLCAPDNKATVHEPISLKINPETLFPLTALSEYR